MGNQSPLDVVVIGASAGGVETLLNLNKALPKNFPSTVFVVVHFPAFSMSVLPDILNRGGNLPAKHAEDGERFFPGKIYVAPPNSHLIINDHTLILDRGPREHGFRPAIDTLFRSAAQVFGPQVIGVILSGTLGDGVAGLLAIKRAGGVTIVQDPQEALFAEMPNKAIENVDVDFVLSLHNIATTLISLTKKTSVVEKTNQMGENENQSAEFVTKDVLDYIKSKQLNHRTILTCPECGGVMWETQEGNLTLFRCHVGHAYSTESFLTEQTDSLEKALWAAIRALEERKALLARLALFSEQRGNPLAAERFRKLSRDAIERADIIRQIVQKNGDIDLETGTKKDEVSLKE